eukprot:554434_1
MGGIQNLKYEELNIENLRQFNANTSRDTDNESIGDNNDEEKELQPLKKDIDMIDDDKHSLASQHGSMHSKQDINVEQHTLDLENQPHEQTANVIDDHDQQQNGIVIEEKMDTINNDSGIPMGIVTPDSFIGNTHESHTSIHKIPNVLHTDIDNIDDNNIEDIIDNNNENNILIDQPETRDNRSNTTLENPEIDPYGNPMDIVMDNNIENILESEEDINPDDNNIIDDEFNYDIEAHDNDDIMENIVDNKPKHISRRSIADMLDDMGGAVGEDLGGLGDEYGSDVEADDGTNDHENWMETAKKWMQKEKQLKDEILDLEDELAKADQMNRDMEIDHEKRLSRLEEEKNEVVEQYEEQIENLTADTNLQIEKFQNDNITMARDVEVLTNVTNEQKDHINDIEAELSELQQNYQLREDEWKNHTEVCPLLNNEIRKAQERKRREEIIRLKNNSTQLDESLGKMLTENKDMEDEIKLLKDKVTMKDSQIETRNIEIDQLREKLVNIKEKYDKNIGAVEELRQRADDEQRQRVELEQEMQKLGNEFDMLMAYSNEQAQVLDMAEFAPTGVDPQKFEAVKNKSKLFVNPRGGSRSIVQSMGGFSEFADHMRTISNMSDALRSGAAMFASDMKMADSASTVSEYSYATSTDIGSIASNFTRFSFKRYHTHDASREFFFLLCLCVKLSLAHKYGVSPDVAPSNEQLWKQALSNNIKFHEYYDFLYNELANQYEYKYKTGQGRIQNVVITDLSKIRAKKEEQAKLKQLENKYNNQSYLYNQYENYTKGVQATSNQLTTMKDRTYFNPNDDIFGGNIKITTRSNRDLKLQNHRSSQSSKRSSKIKHKRKSKSGHGRKSHRHRASSHRSSSHRKSHKQDKEPGNDHDDHPLNDDLGKRRDSEKLSNPPSNDNLNDNNKKRGFHLTQKSLEVLDPNKNSSL